MIAAVGLTVPALLVGCGGSSGESTGATDGAPSGTPGPNSSTGLTIPEFIDAADAICEEENARIKPRSEAISDEGGDTETPEHLDRTADDLRSLGTEIEEGLTRLRALPPPRGKVRAIDSMLNLVASQAVLSASIADAISAGDTQKIDSLGEQLKLNEAKYRDLAQGLGFHQCGAS